MKPALDAFAITFEGRILPSKTNPAGECGNSRNGRQPRKRECSGANRKCA
jgi:hypothetical protein